jgi:GxxExxY protein
MNREDAKNAKEEERRMRQLGEQVEQLAYRVIGAAIEVHRLLGPGFLESVYQESLEVEFRMRGIACHPKKPVAITYKGYSVGEGQLDFLVGDILIVELKAVEKLAPSMKPKLSLILK